MLIITRDAENNTKEGCQSTALLACVSALGKSKRTLAMQLTPKGDESIFQYVIGKEYKATSVHDIYKYENTGLDSLLVEAEMHTVSEEIVNYSVTSILDKKNTFDILFPSDYSDILSMFNEQTMVNVFTYLTNSKNRMYDHIYVYIPLDAEAIYDIVKPFADAEVLFMPQNRMNVKKMLTDDTFLVIKDYEKNSKYDIKFIKKQTGAKHIYEIPHNVGYRDALISETLIDYVHKNRNDMKTDDNFAFISSVFHLVGTFVLGKERIAEMLHQEAEIEKRIEEADTVAPDEPEEPDVLPESAIQQVKVKKRKFFFFKKEEDEIMINM